MRIRSFPLHDEVEEFLKSHEKVFIVELNRDGQLAQIITLKSPDQASKIRNITKFDGMPLSAKWIVNEILKEEEKK